VSVKSAAVNETERSAQSPSLPRTPELHPQRTLQEMMLALECYWAERGCVIQQPYASEVGA